MSLCSVSISYSKASKLLTGQLRKMSLTAKKTRVLLKEDPVKAVKSVITKVFVVVVYLEQE